MFSGMTNIISIEELAGIGGDSHADFEINLTPVERILRRTPLVGVGEYRCSIDHPQFAGGGPEKCPFIVFSRSSVRLIPSRGAPELCTPNTVNLLDVGDSYARRPVSEEGVHADWIAVAPALLREIAEHVDPDLGNRRQSIFDLAVAPITAKTFLAQRMFFNAVNSHTSQLAIEESAIKLLERVLQETKNFVRDRVSRETDPHRRTAIRMRETVQETKAILAREYWSNLSIANLAERVHCSPGYLARSFGKLSGFTLHGYQQQLRLRTSLQLIS